MASYGVVQYGSSPAHKLALTRWPATRYACPFLLNVERPRKLVGPALRRAKALRTMQGGASALLSGEACTPCPELRFSEKQSRPNL